MTSCRWCKHDDPTPPEGGHFCKACGFHETGWPAILIDRPYTPEDAAHYVPGVEAFPDLSVLLKNASVAVRPGGRIGVLDYLIPSPPRELELVALFRVMTGFQNRIRCFSVYDLETP